MSIRARLLLLVLFATSMPVLLIGWLFYDYRDTEIAGARRSLSATAGYLALNLNDKVRGTAQLLYGLSHARELEDPDRDMCSAFLAAVLKEYLQFTGIITIKPDGQLDCDSLLTGRSLDLTDRGYFRTLATSRAPLALEPVFGRLTGIGVMQVAFAARHETGSLRFVLLASLDLEQYVQDVSKSLPFQSAILVLTDDKGTVLARHPKRENAVGVTLPAASVDRLIRAPPGGAPREAEDTYGTARIWAVGALPVVPDPGLRILIGALEADMTAAADRRLLQALAVLAIVSVIVFAGAFLLAEHSIRRPVGKLSAIVDRVGTGDLSARVGPFYARNEIGALGRSFDAMAEAIERHQAALTASEARAKKRSRDMDALFQASPHAIIALDRAAKVMWWNPAAERIFGHRAEDVIGRPHPVVPESESAHFRSHFERAIAGEKLRNIRGTRQAKDGRKIEVEFSSAPLTDTGGNAIGVVYVVNDVTERTQLERQFLQAQKMEAVGQLTGGIAHDFNNLLGVLIGNLDLLRERLGGNPEALELADAALDAGLRGSELNKRLLAFARRQTLSPEIVDVNTTLTAMTELLKRSLGERIDIHLECAADVWPVKVDPAQMESAIVNLAVNARDAMPEGGMLTLETRNATLDADYAARHMGVNPGDYVMLAVTDTGTGMAPEILRRVFDPFFTTKPVGKGTGLGLSMVYGFLKQSGGHVNVYSEPDKGTTVRLYLPRAASGEARREAPAVGESGERAGNELVLVVEDNPDMRRVAVRQLKELGYRVAEAENADRARALLDEGLRPDLMFVDVIMPGSTDGIAFAEEVADRLPGVRILLTSGFTERATVEARKREGRALPFALLGKPYRKTDLARAIRASLDNGKNR